jgi:hypothetical protein
MKKFTYALSLSFALTLLASPSWAYQVELGARFRAEYYWAYRPGTTYGNRDVRQPDLSTFIAAMPSTSYLRLDFTSLDRTTGGRVEIGFGVGPDHGGNRLDLRHIYGWYRFGRCKLIIGHTDNMLAIEKDYAPWQYLGLSGRQATFPLGPSDMMEGFGKLYSGRFTQAILYYYQGPWTFMVSVGQPGLNNSTGWAFSNNAGTVAVTNVWPRLDLAVEYRGKWFALVPGFSISEVRFEPTGSSPGWRCCLSGSSSAGSASGARPGWARTGSRPTCTTPGRPGSGGPGTMTPATGSSWPTPGSTRPA